MPPNKDPVAGLFPPNKPPVLFSEAFAGILLPNKFPPAGLDPNKLPGAGELLSAGLDPNNPPWAGALFSDDLFPNKLPDGLLAAGFAPNKPPYAGGLLPKRFPLGAGVEEAPNNGLVSDVLPNKDGFFSSSGFFSGIFSPAKVPPSATLNFNAVPVGYYTSFLPIYPSLIFSPANVPLVAITNFF